MDNTQKCNNIIESNNYMIGQALTFSVNGKIGKNMNRDSSVAALLLNILFLDNVDVGKTKLEIK